MNASIASARAACWNAPRPPRSGTQGAAVVFGVRAGMIEG
jgi:hypothetical protein